MTDVAAWAPQLPGVWRSWFPQPLLGAYGTALLILVPAGLLWARLDRRQVNGEAAALKPVRFAVSIGVYMLTASAMFRFVPVVQRTAFAPQAAVWIMVIGSTVELACIVLQAARARQSHFNSATPVDGAIYAVMGLFAVFFTGGVVPLAWEIAQRPDEHADRLLAWASVAGLIGTFVVGTATGILITDRSREKGEAKHRRLPLLGWKLTGDDMRPPHFLGIHAMQALPLLAASAEWLSPEQSRSLFASGAVAYGLLAVGLMVRALRGRRGRTQTPTMMSEPAPETFR